MQLQLRPFSGGINISWSRHTRRVSLNLCLKGDQIKAISLHFFPCLFGFTYRSCHKLSINDPELSINAPLKQVMGRVGIRTSAYYSWGKVRLRHQVVKQSFFCWCLSNYFGVVYSNGFTPPLILSFDHIIHVFTLTFMIFGSFAVLYCNSS